MAKRLKKLVLGVFTRGLGKEPKIHLVFFVGKVLCVSLLERFVWMSW